MNITKTAILILIALACAALVALPASAAPPLHRVAGGGWGVTGDDTGTDTDVAGDTIHFTCAAIEGADGVWRGEGTFRGHLDGASITMHLTFNDGMVSKSAMYNSAYLYGNARVSYLGSTSTRPFLLMPLQEATGKPNNILYTALLLGEWGAADFHWWAVYSGGMVGGAINID